MALLYELRDHPVIDLLTRTGERRPREAYRCPCCGGELAPEEPVYLGDEGVIGCAECVCTAEARDTLGPDDAA